MEVLVYGHAGYRPGFVTAAIVAGSLALGNENG